MKYTIEVEIEKPIDEVVALFDNTENLKRWMDGLEGFETFSGTQGEVGAKSKLYFRMGARRFEMIETITSRNLPDEFSGTYEVDGVFNSVTNRFEKVDSGSTRWVAESEFRFSTFSMKVMGLVMPGVFKKQSLKYLRNFKRFAEEGE